MKTMTIKDIGAFIAADPTSQVLLAIEDAKKGLVEKEVKVAPDLPKKKDIGYRTISSVEAKIFRRKLENFESEAKTTLLPEHFEELLSEVDKKGYVYTLVVFVEVTGGTLIYSQYDYSCETYISLDRALILRDKINKADKIKLQYWIPCSEDYLLDMEDMETLVIDKATGKEVDIPVEDQVYPTTTNGIPNEWEEIIKQGIREREEDLRDIRDNKAKEIPIYTKVPMPKSWGGD